MGIRLTLVHTTDNVRIALAQVAPEHKIQWKLERTGYPCTVNP